MFTSELQYDLPHGRIAQAPAERRDQSRLLVFDRNSVNIAHHLFHELPDLLPPQLSILRNDVSVLKARLYGERPTGGRVECLLLRPADPPDTTWRCLLKPGGKTAKAITFGLKDEYSAEVLESLTSGEYLVKFDLPKDSDPRTLAQRLGSLPLPPPMSDAPLTVQTRNVTRLFMLKVRIVVPWLPRPPVYTSLRRY